MKFRKLPISTLPPMNRMIETVGAQPQAMGLFVRR
jgi:hypothetical protein